MTTYVSPTDVEFYEHHTDEALQIIVDRYTAQAVTLSDNGAPELADEAIMIANAAWFALTLRQITTSEPPKEGL